MPCEPALPQSRQGVVCATPHQLTFSGNLPPTLLWGLPPTWHQGHRSLPTVTSTHWIHDQTGLVTGKISGGSLQSEDKNAHSFPLRFKPGYTLPKQLLESNSQTWEKSLQKTVNNSKRKNTQSQEMDSNHLTEPWTRHALPNPTPELQLRAKKIFFFFFLNQSGLGVLATWNRGVWDTFLVLGLHVQQCLK